MNPDEVRRFLAKHGPLPPEAVARIAAKYGAVPPPPVKPKRPLRKRGMPTERSKTLAAVLAAHAPAARPGRDDRNRQQPRNYGGAPGMKPLTSSDWIALVAMARRPLRSSAPTTAASSAPSVPVPPSSPAAGSAPTPKP